MNWFLFSTLFTTFLENQKRGKKCAPGKNVCDWEDAHTDDDTDQDDHTMCSECSAPYTYDDNR